MRTRFIFVLFVFVWGAACSGSGGEPETSVPPVATSPGPSAPPTPPAPSAGPVGARLFKSGPLQITADGATVWAVNTDHDTVTRIDTATAVATEFALPEPAVADLPRGLSVSENGDEVWVACHDSDRVYVLDGASGAVRARIDLPWGSGPHSVALSPDQTKALVTLHRGNAVAAIDVATRGILSTLAVFRTPLGIAWTESGTEAWISHVLSDGEHSRVSRVVWDAAPALAGVVTLFATDPRSSNRLTAPQDIAEGGYLTVRGHVAQIPRATGRHELWLPTQYNNIHEDRFSPDSTIQATLRHVNLDTLAVPNTNADKIILSAVHIHDTTAGNRYVGPGWNASVGGPIDIAFSQDGALALVLCEQSEELVLVPTDATNVRPAGAAPLTEIRVGRRPLGVAYSPAAGVAYVLNRYSRSVSVVDVGARTVVGEIDLNPTTPEPFSAAFLTGAILFHTSNDARVSSNEKVSCASCHINAETDARDWGFHTLAGRSGPRATPTMLGLGLTFGPRDPVTGFGQLHRSGDRDEVQDFEHTFAGESMGGTGFLGTDAQPSLGAPNAGRDADLDAIATYVLELAALPRSPYRQADGSLSEAAVRGAGLFLQAGCATCHVPETGFADGRSHDVGQRRANNEEELGHSSRGAFRWHVRTRTLLGLWATPNYEGVATFAEDIDKFLDDISSRTTHGDIRNLDDLERTDLAAFLLSIDGDLTAAEVRSAADTTAPRATRVEPASLARIDVWFSEPMNLGDAEQTANWTVTTAAGASVTVTAATLDPQRGNRVTLAVSMAKNTSYRVAPGAILDRAGNALDTTDSKNSHAFDIGTELTITLGATGDENLSIAVHDAGTPGPNLRTWSHDAPWLARNGAVLKGWVRFDWKDAFEAATGVASSASITGASVSLLPETGHVHAIEFRRCLQPWSDPATGGDWNQNAVGGPTWRDHSHPTQTWNRAGAEQRTSGVEGQFVSEYNGGNDTAFTPDTMAAPASMDQRVVASGAGVLDAFRFWFDNPAVDYGYVLQLAPSAPAPGLKLHRHERDTKRAGPILTITYKLP